MKNEIPNNNHCLNIIDYGQINLKKYFKVSYLDEFGNGTINYYHGTFKQIQDIIKELFESEKLKASSKDNDMYSADTPLYKFDENTYTCNYYYWEKTSYEYDEWDIKSTSFTLQKIKIKEL